MHRRRFNLASAANRHLRPAVSLNALNQNPHPSSATVWSGSFYPPEIGRGIFRSARDNFPNFHSCNMTRNVMDVNAGGLYVIQY
jgi:hypothetical protein